MNLNTRPNGKMGDAMRKAIVAASVKQEDRGKAMQIWRDFKWQVMKTCVSARDIEALVDAATVRIEAEILGEVLKGQLLAKFTEIRKRAAEMAQRPSEFFGGEDDDSRTTEPA